MFKWLFNAENPEIKKANKLVEKINSHAPAMNALSNEELRDLTAAFRERLANGELLDSILPEAFAAVREASERTIGLRHYDEQMIGGIVLNRRGIAEMKTGEGKTLVASSPLYLNALEGNGAHLITVNDYLVKRDARWMGPIYHALGMTVGILQHESAFIYEPEYVTGDERSDYLRPVHRREAYAADITYGTNNEFGFDYLRDNMATSEAGTVQHIPFFAIVDEVDNILIDEARTPLIISGPARRTTDWYLKFAELARTFVPEDYEVDIKRRSITPLDSAINKTEATLGIPDLYQENESGNLMHADKVHHLEQALKATVLFKRDKDYVIVDGEIVIVDENTGRMMQGRRYSDGLHEALEAKEGVRVQKQTVTYATITIQNYFRMYKKLAGMTGTALTEQEEFFKIYQLEVVPIPTHRPIQRMDAADLVYKAEKGKYDAAIAEVEELHKAGLPVLLGTVSVEQSEELDRMLTKRGIQHSVLNAKLHEQEALIVAQAGRSGAVTIATNMAGRGVDILLGGNPERLALDTLRKQRAAILATVGPQANARVAGEGDEAAANLKLEEINVEDLQHHGFSKDEWEAALTAAKEICATDRLSVIEPREELGGISGLCVIGTERHEARRIDNQLRGRAGRQGDPGYSRFYVSLQDELMKRFGSDRIAGVMTRFGMDESTPIESGAVSKAIESAQTKVEGYNFDMRKHVVQYDDVMNKQREVIYADRRQLLESENLREQVLQAVVDELDAIAHSGAFVKEEGGRDVPTFFAMASQVIPLNPNDVAAYRDEWDEATADRLSEILAELANQYYNEKEEADGEEMMRALERAVMVQSIDNLWVDYLTEMEALREGIGLRAYGQKDPLVEYKIEAARMFNGLKSSIQSTIAHTIFRTRMVVNQPDANLSRKERRERERLLAKQQAGKSPKPPQAQVAASPAQTNAAAIASNAPDADADYEDEPVEVAEPAELEPVALTPTAPANQPQPVKAKATAPAPVPAAVSRLPRTLRNKKR